MDWLRWVYKEEDNLSMKSMQRMGERDEETSSKQRLKENSNKNYKGFNGATR